MVTLNFKAAADKILAAAEESELQQLTAADLRNYIKKLGVTDDSEITDDILNEWIANEVVKRLGKKTVKAAADAVEPYAFKNSKPKQSVLLSKRTRLDTLELGVQQAIDSVLWDEANMFTICPFQVIMGANYSTNAGRKDLSSEVTDYSTLKMVIDGKDTLSVYWRGSYDKPFFEDWKDPSDHSKGTKNIRLTKQLKVGLSYKAFVNKESVNIEFGGLGEGNNMMALQFVESFTAKIPYFNINETFFKRTTTTQSGRTKELLNFDRQQSYLWVVPEVFTTQNLNNYADVVNQNKVYFMMSQIINVQRNPLDKKVLWIECEFRSVNDKLSKSGLTINQFINNGMIGEPTAWPLVFINDKTGKSELKLNPINLAYLPTTHRQITIQGLSMYCGSLTQGWPLFFDNNRMEKNGKFYLPKDNKIDYQRPCLLLWRKFQRPLNDVFNLNKNPESDFYITPIQLQTITSMNALRDVRRWEQGAVEINPIEALFKYSKKTFNTNYAVKNPSSSKVVAGLKMPYWDPEYLNNTKQTAQPESSWASAVNLNFDRDSAGAAVVVSGNDYFNYNSDLTSGNISSCKVGNDNRFDFYAVSQKNLAHYLFFNSLLLKTITALPLAQDNNFALTNRVIGAFQHFLHLITFGLVPDWSRTRAIQHPDFPYIAGLFPSGVLDNYRHLFDYSESGKTFTTLANKVIDFAAGGGILKPVLSSGGKTINNPLGENHLPLNIFADNEMGVWFGAKNTITAIAGELSHVITTPIYKMDGTRTGMLTVTTGDIGQIIHIPNASSKYTEKRVVLINESTKIESPDTSLSDYLEKPKGVCLGYMVNQRHDCIIGGRSIQDKYFSLQKDGTKELTIKDQNCIFYDMYQTRNAFNKNIRLIWNHRRVGNPFFNFGLDPDDPTFSYPDDLQPVPPDTIPTYTWNYNLRSFESDDWSGFFSKTPITSGDFKGCFNLQSKGKNFFTIREDTAFYFPSGIHSYEFVDGRKLVTTGAPGATLMQENFKPLRQVGDWIRKVTYGFRIEGVVVPKTVLNISSKGAGASAKFESELTEDNKFRGIWRDQVAYFSKPSASQTTLTVKRQYVVQLPFDFSTSNDKIFKGKKAVVPQGTWLIYDFRVVNGYPIPSANPQIVINFEVEINYQTQTINPIANFSFKLFPNLKNDAEYFAYNQEQRKWAFHVEKFRGLPFSVDVNYQNGIVLRDLKIQSHIHEVLLHDKNTNFPDLA